MIFRYGKQDFKTMERGQENCFLLTNGLGGFSSCTMINSNSRNDHALLMACVKAPNHRYNMVHRLSEMLTIGSNQFFLSSQQFVEQAEEDGYKNLKQFSFEDIPEWYYQMQGVEIVKKIGMLQHKNTVAVTYEIRNMSKENCSITITPFFQFVKKGDDLEKEQKFLLEQNKISSNGIALYFKTDGDVEKIPSIYETYYYSYDECDGRREHGMAIANHKITKDVPKETTIYVSLVYSMEPETKEASEIIEETEMFRKSLDEKAGFYLPAARVLSKSAAQFIAKRESTKGETILAGFPFFEDWGRDTMIALPGCTLSTKQYEKAKSILYTFMVNERNGLMPNLFPEGKNEPAYNTVDAALLFIHCMYLYYQYTKDIDFVKEAYQTMERIIECYQKGTDYGIHMDSDGLIMAGQGFDQVTWMDVRVGEILPTPRHGKPVEINAYWYNALCIMNEFSDLIRENINEQSKSEQNKSGQSKSEKNKSEQNNTLKDKNEKNKNLEGSKVYIKLAEQVKQSFQDKFWFEEKHCLKDVLSGTEADNQIRCNQIWAVSLPFTMLTKEQELQVVQTVFETLYTPYGLRTLEKEDKEFHPYYGGKQLDRDLAYHQGTVWTFPLGAYYQAYLKVHNYSDEAIKIVIKQLEGMECALREGCIGQLPEIYDGENPSSSKGCFAQAWSVGEILRVYETIENHSNHK